MRLSWGRAREGVFFLLKEDPLSQKAASPHPLLRSDAPSARRNRKPHAAFFGGEREGPLSFS